MAKNVSGAIKHTHKYILRNKGTSGKDRWVYACYNCTHYLPAVDAEGKPTVCWRCAGTTVVPGGRPDGRRIKRPHCLSCTKVYKRNGSSGKSDIDVKKIEKMTIDELLGDIDFSDDDEEK